MTSAHSNVRMPEMEEDIRTSEEELAKTSTEIARKRQGKSDIVQALGKTWHPEHFTCQHCHKPISEQKFNVNEGKPYCENDYAQLFLKRCSGCNLPIRDVVVVALNTTWHRNHFVCTSCGSVLASKGYFERDNNPFCQECYEAKYCPKCSDCNKPIVDAAVIALGQKWHEACFKCSMCRKPFKDTTFTVINENPVCNICVPPEENTPEETTSKIEEHETPQT